MVRNIAKDLIKYYLTYNYHLAHKNSANRILKCIESVKGKTNPKLIKLSNEYASDVLGWRGYSPWLYVYCAVAESFNEGWIPDNYYGKVVIPAMKGSYGKISDLKSITNKVFKSNAFPDIAYHVNGLWYSSDYDILSEKEVKDNIFNKRETVVFKIDQSQQGRGVSIFDESSFEIKKIQLLGNGVVQEYIRQHSCFEELMPNSVVTIRCTTIIDDSGNVSLRACYLRIGRSADTHVKSKSHIRVPVNLKTGELYELGYMTNWMTKNKHPDTNILFEKKQIPYFKKCISTALELHKLIPFVRSIGWDMVVDNNDNVKVMEWNGGHNDIKFSEATQGPCFSDLGWEILWRNK